MKRTFCILLLAALTAGCATTSYPVKPRGAEHAARPRGASVAVSLLSEGREAEARKILVKAVERDPNDRRARSLLRQIDVQPEALLGQESFRYRVRAGDSLSSLAHKHLGDPMLFYALARYNDLTLPATLSPGSVLRIPGREKAPQPARIAKPTPATEPTRPPQGARSGASQRSAKLRVAGLEQLNRGNIDQAVALLEQASASDPNDALARRDLERANRIKHTVRKTP